MTSSKNIASKQYYIYSSKSFNLLGHVRGCKKLGQNIGHLFSVLPAPSNHKKETTKLRKEMKFSDGLRHLQSLIT